ncbi:biopolymer transporter ExbD [Arcobacter sp. FWKO B]|uniref:biopolymer transporter ExbD n=1 Tax=Arcobacter sp. FWKO B TaxID=2593672 RepID=UPI0018A634FE|nr:biopolymer transporter ExbD [Arcobacter sp. FWKO B]QOG12772.1 biopolymer transporter ExbD [Arcobacter sp. FWKO B]
MRSLKKTEGMNVIPFIDVLLVLLAIVFVISNFIALGKIEINLPQASNIQEIDDIKHNIVISQDRQYYINDKEISKEELELKIKAFTKDDLVTISSDKHSLYEDFIFVIDLLKQYSIDKVSMVVKK